MDTSSLLKQEINKTLEDLHDFAKWKLIVASALTATALGLSGPQIDLSPWLLVFVPYACAYVDLNCYQYLLRIFLIAKVLRSSTDPDPLLNKYENESEIYRKKGIFSFGLFAQVGSSIVFSTVTLVFLIGQLSPDKVTWQHLTLLLAVWSAGLILVILCDKAFTKKKQLLE